MGVGDEIAARPAGYLGVPLAKKPGISPNFNIDLINEALKNGLVDVKVCGVNEVWSGLKLVIRLRDR
jgi:hypothetical protein